jgi:putative signal transducing protein
VETVFEAALEVEAHMVRDLLLRAGIPARIDGAFLQSGAGELPPGGIVKVRVAPEHARDAREIIADWEKAKPEPDAPSPGTPSSGTPSSGTPSSGTPSSGTPSSGTPSSGTPSLSTTRRGSWAPYTFFIGGVLGAFAAWLHYNTPVTSDGVDYDNDGKYEERYVYEGKKLKSVENDRNADGRPDLRYAYDSHGVVEAAYSDDDFDGRFETVQHITRGQTTLAETDRDGDGFAEYVVHYEHGVVRTVDFLSKRTGRAIKRSHFPDGWLTYAEYDDNGDGNFERRVEYDEKGDVKP